MTREPTEMELRCAKAACCGEEMDGECKRGREFCDAVDYLRMTRAVMRKMRVPTAAMIEAGRLAEEPTYTGNGVYTISGADLYSAFIDAASPPDGEST